MNLGIAIKKLRKEKGVNQMNFAASVGITQTYLSQIEKGLKHPSEKIIKVIAKELDVSITMIYILASEREDVPQHKKEMYDMLFPSIEGLILSLIDDNKKATD